MRFASPAVAARAAVLSIAAGLAISGCTASTAGEGAAPAGSTLSAGAPAPGPTASADPNDGGSASPATSGTSDPGGTVAGSTPPSLRAQGSGSEPGSGSGPVTTTVPPPLNTVPPAPAAPAGHFAVGGVQAQFVDTTRGTTTGLSSRSLTTTIWYPAAGDPAQRGGGLQPQPGQFPLVVFAHGWRASSSDYEQLLQNVASDGFIVAAPDFPVTSRVNGALDEIDTKNQPWDVSFLITQLLGTGAQSSKVGPVAGHVWPGPVGVMGHSDGALTMLGAGYNGCCIDRRIGAVAILSGRIQYWAGQWFPTGSPPLLVVHGTRDAVNSYQWGQQLFAAGPSPKYFVSVTGADHTTPFMGGAPTPAVSNAVGDFFNVALRHDSNALGQLNAHGNEPGVLSMTSG